MIYNPDQIEFFIYNKNVYMIRTRLLLLFIYIYMLEFAAILTTGGLLLFSNVI